MAKSERKKIVDKDNHTKFVRVVTPRVQKAIKSISLIGRQASPGYDYTPKDVADIIAALRKAIEVVAKQYETKGKSQADFTLS